MASYFGEVLLPVSRAFWDEDDESESLSVVEDQTDLSVHWVKEKPLNIKCLAFVENDVLIDFVKECLCPKAEEVCFVQNQKQEKISSFYQVNSNLYLCIILPKFDTKLCGKFIDKISDLLAHTESTISITYQHMTKFQSEEIQSTPYLLRQLCTRNGEGICKLKVKTLEQPNIVFGVAAGVLSYAEFMGMPSALYILYTDNFVLDYTSAEPLRKLFEAMNCTAHVVNFAGKSFFNKGNLYM